jgi:hypothetical protein
VPEQVPVTLHVYDLGTDGTGAAMLRAFNTRALGVFHVGLEIGFPVGPGGAGWEFSFGFTEEDISGVFSSIPRRCDMHTYRESVSLGHTTISRANVDRVLAKMEETWFGWDYHMLTHNCVLFTSQLCREIGMGPIPRWCGRAAGIGAKLGLFQDDGHDSAGDWC